MVTSNSPLVQALVASTDKVMLYESECQHMMMLSASFQACAPTTGLRDRSHPIPWTAIRDLWRPSRQRRQSSLAGHSLLQRSIGVDGCQAFGGEYPYGFGASARTLPTTRALSDSSSMLG